MRKKRNCKQGAKLKPKLCLGQPNFPTARGISSELGLLDLAPENVKQEPNSRTVCGLL